MVLDAISMGVISNLLTMMGVGFAKKVLPRVLSERGHSGAGSAGDELACTLEDQVASESGEDRGETISFLARQRLRHRVDLAKTKWDWLVLATYFHPIIDFCISNVLMTCHSQAGRSDSWMQARR
jgi:hypothetical protein